jgi:hypothetical protein
VKRHRWIRAPLKTNARRQVCEYCGEVKERVFFLDIDDTPTHELTLYHRPNRLEEWRTYPRPCPGAVPLREGFAKS